MKIRTIMHGRHGTIFLQQGMASRQRSTSEGVNSIDILLRWFGWIG